ncbi:putative mannan endo-1,4-beta-mannosidase F [Pseudovirgaria hyperparasitica]|uniref:mannan endo-1,4-beta-mannosidase n=1 Tax=Pseudovirgaria hyperparasitica TaxID=470096 RepID=A0A6A6WHN8_9PEZI|nr:putative mannan endo-1,4-beta-mannosidase F [Pseudovirgaria hyperparasitica]KAF2762308.1 putative mannan endo-1,4-beta-mannosidase F [Pseudovirgaria hyperparasitica]
MKFVLVLSIVAAVVIVYAQVEEYGKCGGQGYSGSIACVSGYFCQYQNQWYSQCVPGAVTTLITTKTSHTNTVTSALPSSSSTKTPVPGTYVKTKGLKFTIDGVTKYFAGTNSYWIAFLTNNADVDLVLDHMITSGLRILRIWGFNDVNTIPGSDTVYFQYLSAGTATINTGANGLQRLDYVVKAAEARGMKLIINFVNNWNDYGGINAYVNAYGGSKTSWYTNTAAQGQYKAYIKAVVSRYITSTAIFAWELGNEPRCNGCDTSVIYDWATSTSQYIKSLDSNHLVTLGDEGFGLPGDGSYPYTYSEGVDWIKNLGISTLDFGTFHLYPSSWGTTNEWGNSWITTHAVACQAAGKPCLFEEYGITLASDKCSVEGKWQNTSLATTGIAGDLFWDFGDTISSGKTSDDGNTIFYNTADWTCLVTNHVKAIG